MHRKIFQYVLALTLLIPCTGPAFASHPCSDYPGLESGLSIGELVELADFVGVFRVESFEETEDRVSGTTNKIVRYELVQTNVLDGPDQERIWILGLSPYDGPPPHYFAINRLHDQIQVDDPTSSGTTQLVQRESDKQCFFAPRFLVGYPYLILGNVDSQISFEFIPLRATDKWHALVVAAIEQNNIGKARPQDTSAAVPNVRVCDRFWSRELGQAQWN